MKVFALLSCAATVSALPVHANIKVIKVDSKGVAEVQNIPNVDLDEYHSLKELADAAQSSTLHSDLKGSKDVQEKSSTVSTQTDEDFFESFRKATASFFNDFFGTVEQESSKESENTKDLKKLGIPKPHSLKIDTDKKKKHGRHGKHCNGRKKIGKLLGFKQDSEAEKESDFHPAAKVSGFRNHETSGTEDFALGTKESTYTPTASSSALDALKELYQDVRSINYKESFKQISQDEGAIWAVGSGVFCGIFLIGVLSIVFNFIKSRRQTPTVVYYQTDDEETEFLNEKEMS